MAVGVLGVPQPFPEQLVLVEGLPQLRVKVIQLLHLQPDDAVESLYLARHLGYLHLVLLVPAVVLLVFLGGHLKLVQQFLVAPVHLGQFIQLPLQVLVFEGQTPGLFFE